MYCAHCGNEVQTLAANCPTCDKPANGAPAAAGKSGSSAAVVAVVLVVGGLFLVAFIGIVAAIAIPNLINAIDRGRQKRTLSDMRTIATAAEAHFIDYGFYPDADSVEMLAASLEPTYIIQVPLTDGWTFPLHYQCWQEDPEAKGCDHYALASPARDGILDFVDLKDYAGDEQSTNYFDCDIVYQDGRFIRYPEGVQGR